MTPFACIQKIKYQPQKLFAYNAKPVRLDYNTKNKQFKQSTNTAEAIIKTPVNTQMKN